MRKYLGILLALALLLVSFGESAEAFEGVGAGNCGDIKVFVTF